VREYLLYIKVENQTPQAYITPCFQVDQVFWREREGCRLYVIGKSKSLAMAFALRGQLNEQWRQQGAFDEAAMEGIRKMAEARVREANQCYGRQANDAGVFSLDEAEQTDVDWVPEPGWVSRLDLITRLINGRALLWEELETLLQQHGLRGADAVFSLQWLTLRGDLLWEPGISLEMRRNWWKHRLHATCRRCGRTDAIQHTVCHTCRQGCAYCRACLGMGRSKCCTPYLLMASRRPYRGNQTSLLRWSGTFSPLQADAAERARHFVRDAAPNRSAFLIWAVCGAGKTELVFPAAAEVLQSGGQVLIATPRKDVVLELAPRFQQAYPLSRVIAVHGSSPDKWQDADIVIATTHQTMRYYRKFALVVVDEVDAFPYHRNEVLYRAVSRAVAADGKLLVLSATPPRYLQNRLVPRRFFTPQLYSSTHVLLPKRYHGHPLPVPVVKLTRKPFRLLQALITASFAQERQVFVFVPYVEKVTEVLARLQELLPCHRDEMEGVHAADPERLQKVQLFREKRYRLLVTTTILERGVTIPRSDVAVLGADAPVFDEASLVQIAGRVGRSADSPEGTVLFLMTQRSSAPYAAIRQIASMNRLAAKVGGRDGYAR